MEQVSYWHLIWGLGIFLFGMLVFEETLSHLGVGFLKKILEKYTNTRFKSILTGIVETCIFQSSTVVTMMTLGFVGAWMIGLSNALWVVIGANIGTTLTPWLVTFFGFKIDIESFALPMIGIWWIATIIFGKSEKIMNFSKFLIWFGLLFLGLSYMKESVEIISQTVSLAQYSHLPIWWYVLIGTVLTCIIQTSTGATIITLTALNANIISLDMALGIVIGANFGSAITTTIIWLLSSKPTQIQKKKVALSHFIFNISTTVLVTLLYPQIRDGLLYVTENQASNITILALFHTTFNLILAVLRAPLLKPLLRFLHIIFPPKESALQLAIDHINTTLPEEVLHAIEIDTALLLKKVEEYNRHALYLDHSPHYPQTSHDKYTTIKEIEESLLKHIILSHSYGFSQEQARKLRSLNESIINSITSSKYLKDIQHHIVNLKDLSVTHETIASSLHFFQEMTKKTSEIIHEISQSASAESNIAYLSNAIAWLHTSDDAYLQDITTQWDAKEIESINIAEIIKTNRYILLSCESILKSYIDYIRSQS
jgi:phosphate:Na+ symporter